MKFVNIFARPHGRFLCWLLVVVLAASLGRWTAGESAADELAARALAQERLQQLSAAAIFCQQLRDDPQTLPGARSAAEQGLETLQQLSQLYRTEEDLWTYYELIKKSLALRQSYVDSHRLAAEHLQQRSSELARMGAELARVGAEVARVDALLDDLQPTLRVASPSSALTFSLP